MPGERVPAFDCRETWCSAYASVSRVASGDSGRELTPRVRAVGDVVQHLWVLVQGWVQKSERAFPSHEALLVNSIDLMV